MVAVIICGSVDAGVSVEGPNQLFSHDTFWPSIVAVTITGSVQVDAPLEGPNQLLSQDTS